MHYFTCRAKLNGKLKETAFFFSILYLIYLACDIRETGNVFFEHANSHAWLRRSLVVLAEREAISVESSTEFHPRYFSSGGSLPSVVVGRGANFDSRLHTSKRSRRRSRDTWGSSSVENLMY